MPLSALLLRYNGKKLELACETPPDASERGCHLRRDAGPVRLILIDCRQLPAFICGQHQLPRFANLPNKHTKREQGSAECTNEDQQGRTVDHADETNAKRGHDFEERARPAMQPVSGSELLILAKTSGVAQPSDWKRSILSYRTRSSVLFHKGTFRQVVPVAEQQALIIL